MRQSGKLNSRSCGECQSGGILAKIWDVENDWTARSVIARNRANQSAIERSAVNADNASDLDGEASFRKELAVTDKMGVAAD